MAGVALSPAKRSLSRHRPSVSPAAVASRRPSTRDTAHPGSHAGHVRPGAVRSRTATRGAAPFAPAHIEQVATHVAGDKALPPAVLQEVVRKTDGVPLFVEELTKAVLESGLLQEQEDRYALHGPLPPLAIPTTLHASLMARLDR